MSGRISATRTGPLPMVCPPGAPASGCDCTGVVGAESGLSEDVGPKPPICPQAARRAQSDRAEAAMAGLRAAEA